MDQKLDIKGRRKERIRNLLEDLPEVAVSAVPPLFTIPDKKINFKDTEPDPEVMWKERRGSWENHGNGEKPRFVSGFIRRTVASVLVFGAVWGIFAIQQPWSIQAQAFINDALSKDMDFAAARVWYEEHFNGAPAFIPIFGDKEEPAQKAAALHELNPPIAGSIIKPFVSSLKGVEIMPETDSSGSVMVKSVDIGRVLSVSKELQGGIRITIQHSGNIIAEYGHLSGTKLKVDDWLQSGEDVGWLVEPETASETTLFFAVMKDKAYIDPAEVVSFD